MPAKGKANRGHRYPNSGSHNRTSKPISISQNCDTGEAWETKMLQNTSIIAKKKLCISVTNAIMKAELNKQSAVVSVDCEGVNLGNKGEITLIQVGTTRGEAFIFDVQTCPQMVNDGGLKTLLEHEQIIKVIHDCRSDAVALFQQFGVTLRNVFDTQVAHAVLHFQTSGKLENNLMNIALNSLCEHYQAPINPLKKKMRKVYYFNQRYWATRPLSETMILYAASDVLVTINDQLYGNLARQIKPENRKLFSELCTDRILWHIKPNERKKPQKQLKVPTEQSVARPSTRAVAAEQDCIDPGRVNHLATTATEATEPEQQPKKQTSKSIHMCGCTLQ